MNQSTQWSLPAALDVVTDVAPERDMIVWGEVRHSYAESQARTRRLAAFFLERGLNVTAERSELEDWESGQPHVAIIMSNTPEYLEAMIGAYRARAVPYNVNHQYRPAEVAALLQTIGADAIVYHRRFGPLLAEIVDIGDRVLVEVDDGSGVAPLTGSVGFETAIQNVADTALTDLSRPSPDDLYMVCTGGTTGTPKGVLWRQGDIFVAGMNGTDATTVESLRAEAETSIGTYFAAPPLMHGAAQWTAYSAILHGGTAVLHDDSRRFDAATICAIAEREHANVVSIVGDAFARPIIDELRRHPYDLSSLFIIGTGGAATNPEHKRALIELLPHVIIVDGYGSSETGAAGYAPSSKDDQKRAFAPSPGSVIIDTTMQRFLSPEEHEVGWAARIGHIPLGYLGDPDKTRATYFSVDGVRTAVPGDRARYDENGQIVMLGRDSMVINTGGEKVFVEEVEEVLRAHPGVADALVVGRPDERFGEIVVALIEPCVGIDDLDPAELRGLVTDQIARYKAPRALVICERIARFPTGKADYRWAREQAVSAPETMV